jgi:hypothetical protein
VSPPTSAPWRHAHNGGPLPRPVDANPFPSFSRALAVTPGAPSEGIYASVSYSSAMTEGAAPPLPRDGHDAHDAHNAKVTVWVGYNANNGIDTRRPVKFRGQEVARASTHTTEGPGQSRWREYTLYAVPGRGYRVVCTAISRLAHEGSLTTVSPVLTPRDVAAWYPVVACVAEYRGVLRTEEFAVDLDAGETLPHLGPDDAENLP